MKDFFHDQCIDGKSERKPQISAWWQPPHGRRRKESQSPALRELVGARNDVLPSQLDPKPAHFMSMVVRRSWPATSVWTRAIDPSASPQDACTMVDRQHHGPAERSFV